MLPAIRAGACQMAVCPCVSGSHIAGWLESWKAARPETGALLGRVSELPRLNREVRTTPDNLASVFVHDGILDGYAPGIGFQAFQEKLGSFAHFLPQVALMQPSDAGIAKPGARRVRYYQIPSLRKEGQNIALNMRAGTIGRQQVAGNRIVTTLQKRISNAP